MRNRCPNCDILINNTGKHHKRINLYGEETDWIECLDCGELIYRPISDFECKRCGECCFNTCMLSWRKEDWAPIIKYIKEKYDGTLSVKHHNEYGVYYAKHTINSYEDIKYAKENYNILWESLNDGQCPFIKCSKEEKIWYCEIYDIRPMKCREFRCDRDWNEL